MRKLRKFGLKKIVNFQNPKRFYNFICGFEEKNPLRKKMGFKDLSN